MLYDECSIYSISLVFVAKGTSVNLLSTSSKELFSSSFLYCQARQIILHERFSSYIVKGLVWKKDLKLFCDQSGMIGVSFKLDVKYLFVRETLLSKIWRNEQRKNVFLNKKINIGGGITWSRRWRWNKNWFLSNQNHESRKILWLWKFWSVWGTFVCPNENKFSNKYLALIFDLLEYICTLLGHSRPLFLYFKIIFNSWQ